MSAEPSSVAPPGSIPVLVTTEYRGVFFGYVASEADVHGEQVELAGARNCLYWSRATKGFLGLASSGPDSDCLIGPRVEVLVLRNITAVARVTGEAARRWEAAPWKS